MPLIKTQDIKLYYEIHGKGKPLILISGIGYTHRQWKRILPFLSKHFQVITFDNRGVGQSDKTTGPYSAQMLASDTINLLEKLKINKPIVLGHSMGGFVAQSMAINFPSKISKLILCSTHFGGPNHVPTPDEAMKILNDTASDALTRFVNGLSVSTAKGWTEKNPKILKEWTDQRKNNPIDPDCYKAQLAITLGIMSDENSFEKNLNKIECPTLIVFGEEDKVTPKENAYLLSKKIPQSEVVIIPKASHFFPIETPEIAAQKIIEFGK